MRLHLSSHNAPKDLCNCQSNHPACPALPSSTVPQTSSPWSSSQEHLLCTSPWAPNPCERPKRATSPAAPQRHTPPAVHATAHVGAAQMGPRPPSGYHAGYLANAPAAPLPRPSMPSPRLPPCRSPASPTPPPAGVPHDGTSAKLFDSPDSPNAPASLPPRSPPC